MNKHPNTHYLIIIKYRIVRNRKSHYVRNRFTRQVSRAHYYFYIELHSTIDSEGTKASTVKWKVASGSWDQYPTLGPVSASLDYRRGDRSHFTFHFLLYDTTDHQLYIVKQIIQLMTLTSIKLYFT